MVNLLATQSLQWCNIVINWHQEGVVSIEYLNGISPKSLVLQLSTLVIDFCFIEKSDFKRSCKVENKLD